MIQSKKQCLSHDGQPSLLRLPTDLLSLGRKESSWKGEEKRWVCTITDPSLICRRKKKDICTILLFPWKFYPLGTWSHKIGWNKAMLPTLPLWWGKLDLASSLGNIKDRKGRRMDWGPGLYLLENSNCYVNNTVPLCVANGGVILGILFFLLR